MPFARRELQTTATTQPTLAARLMDMPEFDCATLGALVRAAADELATEALAGQARELVVAARQTGATA